MTINKNILCFCAILLLAGCATKPKDMDFANLSEEVEAIKEDGGYYKVGNTYTVLGQTYTPKEDYSYSEIGIASWYGDDFHDKRTANGETYNMRAITAAHRTLPLPSIVKVTNLENGKSIIARVNDRGPYVKNRIIDVSQKGAELLGYKNKGTAKVKVEILADESKALKEAMLSKNNTSKTYANALPTNKIATTTGVNKPLTLAQNTTLKPAETGPFFVQVGAFSDFNKAQMLADSMKRFGNVSIFEAYLSKDGVYRVRIGAYNSRNEALKILDRLLDYGHSDVSIVQG
ncbi:MAG: septal ring lytic transglycosylase RlpA family protein [Alphaproteobacteria bacterium]|nr:septal ring lytic transglycosylase RlpA family protein [Alphaproteobacteria bacterium]